MSPAGPVTIAVTLLLGLGARPVPQLWTGVQAVWNDLDTWSRRVEQSQDIERGVGLRLTGPSGQVSMAFLARLGASMPDGQPRAMLVQVGVDPSVSPNRLRNRSLRLLADAESGRPLIVDLTSRLSVDDLAPGAAIRNAIGPIGVSDFVRLGRSETLRATVFGFDVAFRSEQIKALRSFADQLRLR